MLEARPLPPSDVLERLAEREGLTATRVRDDLEAYHRAEQRGRDATPPPSEAPASPASLAAYAHLGHPGGQTEVTHELS